MIDQARPSERHRLLFWSLALLLAWLPVPLGSNRPWAWAILEVGSLLLLAGWLLAQALMPGPLGEAVKRAYLPLAWVAAWLVWPLLQIVPLPADVLSALSPAAFEAQRYALGEAAAPLLPLSLDPGRTQEVFFKGCAYASLFLLVLVLVDSKRRLQQLAWVLVLCALANALYGFADHFADGGLALFSALAGDTASVHGTYPNYSHFGGLLELSIPLTLGLTLRFRPLAYAPTWKARLAMLAQWLLSGIGLVYLVALILLAGLVFSTSRGALLSFLASLFITTAVFATLRGRHTREVRFLRLALVLLAAALVWLGVGGLGKKLEQAGLETNRPQIYASSLSLISDFPIFGSGAGSFESVFPLYKDPALGQSTYDHAHNDYLETLADQGLVGLLLAAGFVVFAYRQLARGIRRRRDPLLRGILFGALGGTLSLLFHAMVDFNFQIPANAAWFMVLLAMGIAATVVPGGPARRRHRHPTASDLRESLLGAVVPEPDNDRAEGGAPTAPDG